MLPATSHDQPAHEIQFLTLLCSPDTGMQTYTSLTCLTVPAVPSAIHHTPQMAAILRRERGL